ncbi:MAG: hypothetical protein AAGF88_05605 [Pseudomonadota bacterium]
MSGLRRALSLATIVFFLISLAVGGVWVLIRFGEPIENAEPPCEQENCGFKVLSRNRLGNQNIWIYGENDDGYYYWFQNDLSDPHPSISRELASNCQSFDPLDVLTWADCGADIRSDCEFVTDAMQVYEYNSTASEHADRYSIEPYSDPIC